MHEKFDPVVKADQRAQYAIDSGIPADTAADLTLNNWAVFECIHKAGFKQTLKRCHDGVQKIEFLGKSTSPEEISPSAHKKKQNFLNKLTLSKPKEGLQRFLGFVNSSKNNILSLAWNINPFQKLIIAEPASKITSAVKKRVIQ